MTQTISFTAGRELNDEIEAMGLKISSDAFELNVHVPVSELGLLDQVLEKRWVDGAVKIGTSANAPAWWSSDDDLVSICVGTDDQLWDIGITFPVAEFATLRACIDEELKAE